MELDRLHRVIDIYAENENEIKRKNQLRVESILRQSKLEWDEQFKKF